MNNQTNFETSPKQGSLLLTIVAVATLLVAVGGAAFAYFSGSTTTTANIALNAVVANGSDSVFSATSQGSLELNITAAQMAKEVAGALNTTVANETAVNTANVTVSYTSTASITCTYNLVYNVITGSDTYTKTTAAGTNNEFVIEIQKYVDGVASGTATVVSYPAVAAGNSSNLLTGETIKSNSSSTAKVNKYEVRARFYNLNVDQASQKNKHYKGTVTVSTPSCVAS